MKIALLIPTLNAGDLWKEVLESINKQDIDFTRKIIVDSGSVDETVKSAKSFGFEVITIHKSEFNHGATRQYLVDLADDSEICIFLTQDAVLASSDSISNIVSVFKDSQLGIAYGRQLPNKNAKPLETHLRLFNYPEVSEVVSINDIDKKGFKVFFCSNSFSAYRKNALMEVGGFPFDSIMGEDAIVAAKILMAGYKKAYVSNATVYHSHSYTFMEEFKRYFDTRVFHEQNQWLIEKYGRPTGEGIKFIKSELRYVFKHDIKSLFKSIMSIIAKWSGYRLGKYFRKLPINTLRNVSMHKYYWKK